MMVSLFSFAAPLPNLTSDDIDRALAPASSQGENKINADQHQMSPCNVAA